MKLSKSHQTINCVQRHTKSPFVRFIIRICYIIQGFVFSETKFLTDIFSLEANFSTSSDPGDFFLGDFFSANLDDKVVRYWPCSDARASASSRSSQRSDNFRSFSGGR